MKTLFHKADSRGAANHGWLQSYHSFSFANYYNPERMQFGALRVLNDDRVAPGMGFGTHPHRNMEIISIPLEGDLEHQDNMGNTTVIREGDIQVMSAGTGVTHSEYNKNKDREVAFLQIWVIPHTANVEPRYGQISLEPGQTRGQWHPVIGPHGGFDGLWIYQDAWFHLGEFKAGTTSEYTLKNPKNGLYVFVITGNVSAGGQTLDQRDALGVWDTGSVSFEFLKDSRVLLLEVPLEQGA
ncbi:pirin family protein [Robiginitalea sp. M366]|uniref:pirin family protein n=1 Tax=Robiginitalea aestuariiviva TaxID=3036903 RepID=UPI00240D0062|nr:pirin family protein [Robiginitalea aestuariiviva]MDG1570870.1 pirin family protein [Robiginitalea aestuariiviva]